MHVYQNDLDIKDKKGLLYLLISASTFELKKLKHFHLQPPENGNLEVSWRTKVMVVVVPEMPPF